MQKQECEVRLKFIKIIYLHQYFNTPNMAGGTRSYEMGRRLVEYGHQVEMITSYRRKDSPEGETEGWFQTEESGIRIHWLPVPYSNKMSYRQRIKAFVKFAWKAARKAASIEGDIVFATSTPLTIALPAVYAARKNKVPMVFEVRDLWPELPIAVGALKNPILKWAARRLERFAYNNSKRIIALSPGMKEGIVKTGYPASKVEIIPNSSDIDFFNMDPEVGRQIRLKYQWLGERPLVVYAGTIGIINGVDYLARLAGVVWKLDQEIRFVVIGEGQGGEKMIAEAEAAGVLDRSFFVLPRMPKIELRGWISAADLATSVFIDLEEMWNNSANKFFDALASGTPVAINYGGWQKKIIEESGAGLVLDPNNIDAAAGLLVDKLRDGSWLGAAGRAAIKLARERFDRNKLAKKLEAVLLVALNENEEHKIR
jgi:glycosyltransferase involved in cell wall biosynthesis